MIKQDMAQSCVQSSSIDNLIDLFICPEENLQLFQNDSSKWMALLDTSLKTSTSWTLDGIDEKSSFKASKNQEDHITQGFQQIQTYRSFDENQSKSINKKYKEQNQNKFSSKLKDKNSNSVKKIGRIILDNLSQYDQFQGQNFSVKKMIDLLSHSKGRVVLQEYKKRDRFNTQHLKQLFNPSDPKLMNFNLKKTQRLLCRYLRKVVMKSDQIKDSSKLIYLNTMKCSALRCANHKLAVRLQMSNQYK